MSYGDFAKRVDNKEVKGGTQPSDPVITIEDIDNHINERLLIRREKDKKDKAFLPSFVYSAIFLVIVSCSLAGLTTENIVLSIIIAFYFAAAVESFS
jgi:hypothetical protein